MKLAFRATSRGIAFRVRLKPRSSRNAVLGEDGGTLVAAVTKPPVDGRANEALIELLSERFRLPKKAFTISSGAASREKTILVAPAFEARFREALASESD